MSFFKYFLAIIIIAAYVLCDDVTNKLDEETSTIKPTDEDINLTGNKEAIAEVEKVGVKIYYETLCPYCVRFFVNTLQHVYVTMHDYIHIQLYPYGNAETTEVDGHYEFACQHGEDECYGNKLHACAIDILKNVTKSTLFNCCLMEGFSNDNATTECGTLMKVDANPIKECAKGDKGNQLLKYYGDENAKMKYRGVPCIYVNGIRSSPSEFKQNVCAAFTNAPPPCKTTDV